MTIENLVSLQGPLAETFSRLDPNTIQHSAEITKARRTNKELRNQWFWTDDGVVYTIKKEFCESCGEQTKDEAYWHLTEGKDNPVFKNIKEASKQLRNNHNYILEKGNPDLEAALNSEKTLKTKLSDLKLQSNSDERSYFEFDTKNYKKKSNKAQIAVIERVFSEEGVKVLRDNGIKRTKIYTLTPNYVKKHTEKDSAIARACRLNYFGNDSRFYAVVRYVDDPYSRLFGVPKIAEGSAKKFGVTEAYQMILNNPQELNEEKAKKLLNLVNNFYTKKQ